VFETSGRYERCQRLTEKREQIDAEIQSHVDRMDIEWRRPRVELMGKLVEHRAGVKMTKAQKARAKASRILERRMSKWNGLEKK
jgi:hypothetical protein